VVREPNQNVPIPQPEHQQLNAVNNVEQESQQPNDPQQPGQDDQSNDTQHDTLTLYQPPQNRWSDSIECSIEISLSGPKTTH
jgi:hypothetical protein